MRRRGARARLPAARRTPAGTRPASSPRQPGSGAADGGGEPDPAGERVHGEIIEGDERHPAGTYVVFAPGSRHQPRTDVGAQIIGYTVLNG
ncbi:hypothetical protein ABZ840_31645 [Streptomyces sp. NPDC047117]|uniref:hypothetical protein n=1 Tax=Streptomyces sp. NPDC047117 TaxID=3155379 RepID=UPI0033C32004